MKKTIASRLLHRVILQQPVQAADGAGGYVQTWQDVATIWAEIKPVSGRESFAAGQLQALITHKIIIRSRNDVTDAMRFADDGRLYKIRSMLTSGAQQEAMELLVTEGGN